MDVVIGIDEVGRGSWAGPLLVVAAQGDNLPLVKDSKLLSRIQRENLCEQLLTICSFGEGWVAHHEVDSIGLTGAMRLGVQRALENLKANPADAIIMDGKINYCSDKFSNVRCVIKADSLHPIVSAASIYAKVKRDHYMAEIARQYPNYQFEKHVGYGTKLHSELLKKFGVSPIHRVSYKPIQALI